jgi:hypothetical protein
MMRTLRIGARGARAGKACGDRALARAGIRRPALDETWGALLHSAAGWSLSGPEYLGFVRLLRPNAPSALGPNTQRWIRSTEGKWFEGRAIAYTLGVNVRQMPNMTNLFHAGAWTWRQFDAAGGAIDEEHGTWFVLAGDEYRPVCVVRGHQHRHETGGNTRIGRGALARTVGRHLVADAGSVSRNGRGAHFGGTISPAEASPVGLNRH